MAFKRLLSIALLLLTLPVGVLAQTPPDLEKQVLDILKRNPQAVYEALRTYQVQGRRAQRLSEWQQNLQKPVQVDISAAPVLGPQQAAFTLIEFSDFQCPYCVRSQPALKTLLEKYKGQMRLVFMHLPLSIHAQARPAAQAAWAAGRQGKFFEYHDRLFALEEQIKPESFERIARDLKLDLTRFNQDRESPQAVASVAADVKQASSIGAEGTPTWVLNGLVLRGALSLEDFEEALKLIKSKAS